jgi:hypothetical protein
VWYRPRAHVFCLISCKTPLYDVVYNFFPPRSGLQYPERPLVPTSPSPSLPPLQRPARR